MTNSTEMRMMCQYTLSFITSVDLEEQKFAISMTQCHQTKILELKLIYGAYINKELKLDESIE